MRYQFIEKHIPEWPVTVQCRVLKVSRSGFYEWRRRPKSEHEKRDEILTSAIEVAHRKSRGTYGSPRVYEALRREGQQCGKNRVARLMAKAAEIQSNHGLESQTSSCREYSGPSIPCSAARREMARGYYLHLDKIRMDVSGGHSRYVFPAHCRLGSGKSDDQRVCLSRPKNGNEPKETAQGAGSSFG